MAAESTSRFSDRVENYVKYRPGYPEEVISLLKQEIGLNGDTIVTDVGAGTGIFTKMILNEGCEVYAVEPNQPMRAYAEVSLKFYPKFHSIDGTANDTKLPVNSCDLVVCAQAFHWFNNMATKQEFKRILKPEGFVALIWNNRQTEADDFAIAYDALLKEQSNDYKEVNHQNLKTTDFKRLFKNGEYTYHAYPNVQIFDFAGLRGRAFSSSYIPSPDTTEGKAFEQSLHIVFDKFQQNGKVNFKYQTEVYLGKV